jgi:hypothetical protein
MADLKKAVMALTSTSSTGGSLRSKISQLKDLVSDIEKTMESDPGPGRDEMKEAPAEAKGKMEGKKGLIVALLRKRRSSSMGA